MTIGQTIAQLRKEHGLTQEQLAERLLVSRQAVSKWETGAAQPDLDNIRALSAFFEVSADVFLQPVGQELPAEPPEPDGKREKRSWSWLLLAVLACAAPVLGWLGVRVLARHGAVVLYGWLVPLTATVFALGGVAALLVLYRRKRPAALDNRAEHRLRDRTRHQSHRAGRHAHARTGVHGRDAGLCLFLR